MKKKSKQPKYGTKDSVFTHLFSIPKYQLQLYKTLHPEDKRVKASDIETITKKCVVAQHEHNDLGILVKDTLMILVEAQSSWSPNIVIRLMSYAVQSLMDYFEEREVFLYSNSKAVCPRIELYVIYTGQRKNEPETLTFKELFFAANERCDLNATAHVIYYKTDKTDIINQYIMFCRVFNEQIKLFGYTEIALKETLRICRNQEILTQYISNHYLFIKRRYRTQKIIHIFLINALLTYCTRKCLFAACDKQFSFYNIKEIFRE